MNKQKYQGYVAFSSLLVISAVALAVAVSIALISVTSIQSTFASVQGKEVQAAAIGCAHQALLQLRDDLNYAGESLTLGDATCIITITTSPPNHIIDISSSINLPPLFVQKLHLIVRRLGRSINILSWEHL